MVALLHTVKSNNQYDANKDIYIADRYEETADVSYKEREPILLQLRRCSRLMKGIARRGFAQGQKEWQTMPSLRNE